MPTDTPTSQGDKPWNYQKNRRMLIRMFNEGRTADEMRKKLGYTKRGLWATLHKIRVKSPGVLHERRGRDGVVAYPDIVLADKFGANGSRQQYDEGWSFAEMASAAGVSRNKLHYAIARLRKTLGWFPPGPDRTKRVLARAKENYLKANADVIRLRGEGLDAAQIAAKLGVPKKRVRMVVMTLIRHGAISAEKVVRLPPEGVDPQVHYADLIKLYDEGLSQRQIGIRLGLSYGSVENTVRVARERFGLFQPRPRITRSPRQKRVQVVRAGQTQDATFQFVTALDGEKMEDWRQLAAGHLAFIDESDRGGYASRLWVVGRFLHTYIAKHGLYDPRSLLEHKAPAIVPRLDAITGARGHETRQRNYVLDFLDWVLRTDSRFCQEDDDGRVTVFADCYNPFPRSHGKQSKAPQLAASVRSPLPYKYIVQLRDTLAQGPNFRDWKWAHGVAKDRLGGARSGSMAGDWIEVDESIVERGRTDPDFVGEERVVPVFVVRVDQRTGEAKRVQTGRNRRAFFMWCPETAVALLVKLHLPLRTFQVRCLDGGWTDVERCELTENGFGPDGEPNFDIVWRPNADRSILLNGLLKPDRERVGPRQGVFRKMTDPLSERPTTAFFINTNKTADVDKDWVDRGYIIHWENRQVLRWLLKLRNWQEKYNPITKPALWAEMRPGLTNKKPSELNAAPPTCFLFRHAASKKGALARTQIMPDHSINWLWEKLLLHFEDRLWKEGVRTHNGDRVKLTTGDRVQNDVAVRFPLHALRVSLLTALAFEGGVSLETLMKLAGHSRILMAIYYQKLGSVMFGKELEDGFRRALERGDERVQGFLMEQTFDEMMKSLVCWDSEALKLAIPVDPADRSPAGWLRVGCGYCLMGGNTAPGGDSTLRIGGCFNGGRQLNLGKANPMFESVAPRNCVGGKCRWFVTRPEFIREIETRLKFLTRHVRRSQESLTTLQHQSKALAVEKKKAEEADRPFLNRSEESRLDLLIEKAASELNEHLTNFRNSLTLFERCRALLRNEASSEQYVAQGAYDDVRMVLEATESELLELSGVSLDAEFFPEYRSELGGDDIRRNQIIDAFFLREYGTPILLRLQPDEQNRLANRLTREIAGFGETQRPGAGLAYACEMIEGNAPMDQQVRELVDSLNVRGVPLRALMDGKRPAPQIKLLS